MCTLHKVGGEVSKGRRVLRIARNKLKTIDLMLNRYPYCIPCAKNNQRVGMRSLLKKTDGSWGSESNSYTDSDSRVGVGSL